MVHMGMSITQWSLRANELSRSKGSWDGESGLLGNKISCLHEEVSEITKELRKPEPSMSEKIPQFTAEAEECADVILRILDYARERGIPVEEAMIAKHRYNETRPPKHGKRFT